MNKTWKRAAVAAVAALALAGGTHAVATAGQSHADASEQGQETNTTVRVVEPYEPVDIGADHQLALLPEGDQNYVVAPSFFFDKSLEEARKNPVEGIGQNSISVQVGAGVTDLGEGPRSHVTYSGAWRSDAGISKVTVETGAGVQDAELVELPGSPGWGAYYLSTGDESVAGGKVTAYDAEGKVFAEEEFDAMDAGNMEAGGGMDAETEALPEGLDLSEGEAVAIEDGVVVEHKVSGAQG